jgi:hypothetical protein
MINESQKPWTRPLSDLEYDLAVLTKKEFLAKWPFDAGDYKALIEDREDCG